MKRPHKAQNADYAIWTACRFLDELASVSRGGCGGCFPSDLARYSGMTRLESQLALRMCVEIGRAIRRSDGRFFKKESTA